jgi:hypothetical protein
MTINSLLTALQGQEALQAENIALRHQLIVLQRTRKPTRPVLKQATDVCGFGCRGCGRNGVLP